MSSCREHGNEPSGSTTIGDYQQRRVVCVCVCWKGESESLGSSAARIMFRNTHVQNSSDNC